MCRCQRTLVDFRPDDAEVIRWRALVIVQQADRPPLAIAGREAAKRVFDPPCGRKSREKAPFPLLQGIQLGEHALRLLDDERVGGALDCPQTIAAELQALLRRHGGQLLKYFLAHSRLAAKIHRTGSKHEKVNERRMR